MEKNGIKIFFSNKLPTKMMVETVLPNLSTH